MKDKVIDTLKWDVIIEDWNNGSATRTYNIFHNANVYERIPKLIKNYTTFENFKEELTNILKYSFWSKREYEIWIHIKDNEYEKIDMWEHQLQPTLDVLAYYIVRKYNEHKRKKLDMGE